MRTSTHDDLVRLMEAATAVALCVLLGNLRLVELPSGGSISLAAVPLLAYAAVRGGRGAFLACWCAGAAHALSGGTIIHPLQLVLDYVLAYGVLAVPALTGARTALHRTVGIVIAMLLQLAVTTLSGVLFFASVAGAAAWRYSLAYNAATIVPELVLALIAVPVAIRALQRADPACRAHSSPAAARAARRPRIALVPVPAHATAASSRQQRRAAAVQPSDHRDPLELPRRATAFAAAMPAPAGVPVAVTTTNHAPLRRPAPFASAGEVPWRRTS